MPEKEYIEREALPLKKFIQTAQMFSDDIICAIGTNFMQNIAEAENKELFEIIKAIQTAPTADVAEVKHGHWKDTEYGFCSVCNRSISEIYDSDSSMVYGILDELTACPFCGAKMDGGVDNDKKVDNKR